MMTAFLFSFLLSRLFGITSPHHIPYDRLHGDLLLFVRLNFGSTSGEEGHDGIGSWHGVINAFTVLI
jgi:hypothetical protein